jgi:pimeloyl-ACP methyl ester carboxylesterase
VKFLKGLLKAVAWIAGIYLALLVAIYFLQDFLVYPGRALYREGAAEWRGDVNVLKTFGYDAVEIPAEGSSSPPLIGAFSDMGGKRPVIVWFHGREESLPEIAHQLKPLRALGNHVFAVEYRGYGPAPGNPGEKAILEDAKRVVEWLKENENVDNSRIYAGGFGLGAVVALHVAAEESLDGVIALSPFGNLAEIVSRKVPFVPLGFVLSDRWDARAAAARVRCDVFVAYGAAATPDRIAIAKDLKEILGDRCTLQEVPGAEEDTIFSRGGKELWEDADASLR